MGRSACESRERESAGGLVLFYYYYYILMGREGVREGLVLSLLLMECNGRSACEPRERVCVV